MKRAAEAHRNRKDKGEPLPRRSRTVLPGGQKILSKAAVRLRVRYRFYRRMWFKTIRLATFFFFRLWIKELEGFDRIPEGRSALLVSNHLSYYDFLILGALFRHHIVFLAVNKIRATPFIRWFTKLHFVVYVDRDHPGPVFFKQVMRHIQAGKLIVVYPEGSRSRTGKMLRPKPGFVKLAMRANIPIIPVAMRGTYEILPPQRKIPRFRKCAVRVGNRMYISPNNPEFTDVFFAEPREKISDLSKEQIEEVAVRVMEKVRMLAGEEWDERAADQVRRVLDPAPAGEEGDRNPGTES
ncbi:MAG: hypothetical protein GF333_05625 [Candidatus Omnitrophica bacterium]|nr:hypothetical protein [Candidatus Omnitrophota bacterium]